MLEYECNIAKKLKLDEEYYVEDVKCSCKKCANISEEDKQRIEKDLIKKDIIEYSKKCVGKLHKKPATYVDDNDFTKFQPWFIEKGISYKDTTYCLYCTKTKCPGLENKELFKIPSNIVATFPAVNCDCPHCK